MRIPHSSGKEKKTFVDRRSRPSGGAYPCSEARTSIPVGAAKRIANIPQKSIKAHKPRSLEAWRSLE